jgi:drug/metabolite transporter (DMT)-like permease
MILTVAFLWAGNTVYIKRIIHTFEPFHMVLYPIIFSVPFFFIAGFIWDDQMVTFINTKILISLLYQSLITASFGFVAWNYLLQKYSAVSLHSFIFIMPISGVLLGGLILAEPITINLLLALLLIVSGIVVVNLKTRRYITLFYRGIFR